MFSFTFSAIAPPFLCFLICILVHRIEAVPEYLYHVCSNTTTFTPNSTYQNNLNELLSSLSSNATSGNGFYNTTTGKNNPGNTVYGLFLCRGDVTTETCQDCVSTATKEVIQRCPTEKESIIWYDVCLLHYSSRFFFSTVQESPIVRLTNTGDVSEPNRFMQLLEETMKTVVNKASNGGADKKFATKEAIFDSFQTLYTLGQCLPDLSVLDCNRCLEIADNNLPSCCGGKRGGRVLMSSCNVRFELYPFYQSNQTKPLPPVPTSVTKSKGKTKIVPWIIIAIVAAIVISLVLVFLCYRFLTRGAKKKYDSVPEDNVEISSVESLQFDLVTIKTATNNFSDENKLGEGGFGAVYKGSLSNGQDVAVKRLSTSSRQGAEEFKNEVVLVAKLQHRNLARLLGFCFDEEEKILVYEFVPNKSLDHILFDPERQRQLEWSRRYKIIGGIARGMLYLHEDSRLRIIHRDLKASNILLDEDLNPKISDFGMAKIFGVDQTQGNTSRVVGTFGYMSPEYAMHGQFSVKSDVYSFGVLILEIISGRKNSRFQESNYAEDLLSYAWKHWNEGTALELLDPSLRDSFSRHEVIRCIHIGLLCVHEDPTERPTMQTIVIMLSSDSVTLPTPKEPAFFLHSATDSNMLKTDDLLQSDQSISKSIPLSVDEASITEVYPR